MKICISLILFLLPITTTIELKFTNCETAIRVDNKYYKRSQRYSLRGMPADLIVNWKTEDIYFILISKNMDMKLQMIRNLSLSYLELDEIGQATAIRNGVVYVGTSKGVYIKKGDIFEQIIYNEDVMYLAVGKSGITLYLSTYPQNGVIKVTDKNTERMTGIPNGQGLKIDSKNNLYFAAYGTPYILQFDSTTGTYNAYSEMIKGLPKDEIYIFAISKDDKVYVMDRNSLLYLVDGSESKYLGDFDMNCNTFAFDSKGNILIGTENMVVKFNVYDACYKFKTTTTATTSK